MAGEVAEDKDCCTREQLRAYKLNPPVAEEDQE